MKLMCQQCFDLNKDPLDYCRIESIKLYFLRVELRPKFSIFKIYNLNSQLKYLLEVKECFLVQHFQVSLVDVEENQVWLDSLLILVEHHLLFFKKKLDKINRI